MMMVLNLAPKLPKGFAAEPRVHLGTYFEIDVCTFDKDGKRDWHSDPHPVANGGVATATQAPPAPTLTVDVDFPDQYVYEEWDSQIASSQRPVGPAGCARSVGSALTAGQLATIGDSAWYSCISPRNQRRRTGCSPNQRRESPGRRADRLV